MTGSDRPEPIDPADDSWPQEDPDLTRVVPRGASADAASAPADVAAAAESAADSGTESVADAAGSAIPTGAAAESTGTAWSNAGSVASSWSATGPVSPEAPATPASQPAPPPTTMIGPPSEPGPAPYPTGPSPTAAYGYAAPDTGAAAGVGMGATGGQDYQGPYGISPSYQQPYASGPGPSGPPTPGGGPQVILPPATNVILPPTKIPKAESRVGINAIGTILGILLVFGGLILVLRFGGFRGETATGGLSIDYLKFTWFVLGAVLVALPTFLVAWASWTALIPGIIVTGATIWAMITPAADGAYYIDKGTGWAFGDVTLGQFAAAGYGLLVGLPLLLTGLAAMFLRSGVRRTIVKQVASLQQ